MKRGLLEEMLSAEVVRATWQRNLLMDIRRGAYTEAMHSQLQYLYWNDEYLRLYHKVAEDYWDFRLAARGMSHK